MRIKSFIRRLTQVRCLQEARKVIEKVPHTWTEEGQVQELRSFFVKEERRLRKKREQQQERGPRNILELKRELRQTLGIKDPDGFDVQSVEVAPLDSSLEERSGVLHNVCISLKNGTSVRGILGWPRDIQNTRLPAVICLHGSRSRPEILFDIEKSEHARQRNKEYERAFPLALMRNGYVVFAPYLINDFSAQTIREELDLIGIPLGHRLVGIEVAKVVRTIEFLSEHSRVDSNRIGVYGVSSGGAIGMWAAALDDRVKVTVLSNTLYNGAEAQALATDRTNPASASRTGKHSGLLFNYLSTFSEETLISMLDGRYLFVEMGKDDLKTKDASRYIKSLSEQLRGTSREKYFGYEVASGLGHQIVLNQSLKFLQEKL